MARLQPLLVIFFSCYLACRVEIFFGFSCQYLNRWPRISETAEVARHGAEVRIMAGQAGVLYAVYGDRYR